MVRRPINRRNTGIVLIVVLIVLGIVALQSGQPSDGEQSPEAVALRSRPAAEILLVQPGPPDLIGCIRFCWFADDHPSALVLYPDPSDADNLNWDLTGESGGDWFSLSAGSIGPGPTSDGEPSLTNFFSMPVPGSSITYRYGVKNDYLMVLGRTAASEVAQIELTYDTGQNATSMLRSGAFAAFANANAVCSVRLMDNSGTVLREFDAASDLIRAQPAAQNTCGG